MRMQHAIDIQRSPDDLWPWLTEPEQVKQWMKGLLEITPVSEGEPRVGFKSRLKIKEGKRISDYDEEILKWSPPHALAVRMTGGCMPDGSAMECAYTITDMGDRSRIDAVTTGDLKGFWKLFAPLMKFFAGAQQKSFFKTLKRLAEAQA